MAGIFDDVKFIGEASKMDNYKSNDDTPLYEQKILSETGLIKDCSIFVTEEMIMECSNDKGLIRQQALLEGAKFSMWVKNFLKEGKDYKGLKKELKTIMDANNMSDKRLRTGQKGFMHAAKRILQIYFDICYAVGGVSSTVSIVGAAIIFPPAAIGGIVGLIVGIIINRLLRFAVDSAEFDAIRKDAEDIVDQLRKDAKVTKSKSVRDKLNRDADRLEKAIEDHRNR